MKKIEFQNQSAQKIYNDYIKRTEKMVKTLPEEDRKDVLMEFNSHIYESMQHTSGSEVESLVVILEKMGDPEQVLVSLVADKKLAQATKTFNPLHVFKALALNITNGISYIIFSILYLMLFCFIFLIFLELVSPENTGLFYNDGAFTALGFSSDNFGRPANEEVLGNWFIPVMLVCTVAFYFLITGMLRVKRKFIK